MNHPDLAAVGALLLAIGCADLASTGLSGIVTSNRRALRGLVLGLAFGLLAGYAAGVSRPPWWAIVVTAATLAGWLFSRVEGEGQEEEEEEPREENGLKPRTRAQLSLALQCVLLLITLTVADRWPSSHSSWLDGHLSDSDIFGGVGTSRFMLLTGLAIYLGATSNAIVRQALTLITGEWTRSAQQLQAGRVIGLIERLFILGFLVAGQATGAGLVISAKAVLRLPEMTRREDEKQGHTSSERKGTSVEPFSEYVLVGSMISWILAFAAGALAMRI